MTEATRDWRDAKIPQWVKDAVLAEIDRTALTAALAWPTEAKPSPMSFKWVDYDAVRGVPVAGRYWTINGWSLEIREKAPDEKGRNIVAWKPWLFRVQGYEWTSDVTRGDLYATEHDAKVAALWSECEIAAKRLLAARKRVNA